MAFSLTRPSSPVTLPQITQDEDLLANQPRLDLDMLEKERPCLEVHLDNEFICLKGTGNDVEPARLTGHVALHLAESTPIKEITLQFRGKARLPPLSNEANGIHINNGGSTYIVCNHDWSFLEGEKKHSHTLKAGRHFFPFQLQIGGMLPSSVSTHALGGASVAYKLRAHAVRPGLNHNLQAVVPVTIMRSFSSEALEYQQTLEIENTWPDKLMYSIMIPHKAWAATDTLTALVKFCPLSKGVGVVSVTSSIHETTKIQAKSASQDYTRSVVSVKHEFIGGKAVEVLDRSRHHKTPSTPGVHSSTPSTPGYPTSPTSPTYPGGGYFSLPRFPENAEAGPSSRPPDPAPLAEQGDDDIVAYISIHIPSIVTPTHPLDPINVSHRIRWSILIMNLDGHTSELRCSLPLHLLDQRLLKEARAHTSATRRLLIGGSEVPPEEEEEVELPSYKSHVRDRIANMYLPEAATVRVTNPWMSLSTSTTPPAMTPALLTPSGQASPLDSHMMSHLPHAPGSGDSTPLDWVNSELLLSMQGLSTSAESWRPSAREQPHASTSASNSDSEPNSQGQSRPSSNRPSRRGSRASSPERHHEEGAIPAIPVAGPNETYVHRGNASRNLHGVFNASMKPFTSLAHPHWLSPSRSTSHTSLSSLTNSLSSSQQQQQQQHARSAGNRSVALPGSDPALLQRAYTSVPDYGVAARGFIGGVPPLSSMQGLPSYEEAERHQRRPPLGDRSMSTPAIR
ncbi:hypothetical protein FB45DRAFT_986895 [Roridomyces roridus]|uniref:Arrestin C-terminal-like domain-containing protein n=1 Tax=Roridomyces roridus TaxID=1738132 RepID=A0AAD7FZS1_9AGAR|nr:hypothetical protein FB45DRAFT_986895 [Roridomyces roridus]